MKTQTEPIQTKSYIGKIQLNTQPSNTRAEIARSLKLRFLNELYAGQIEFQAEQSKPENPS